MLLSTVSVLVVAQSSSEIPEGLMNNPVLVQGRGTQTPGAGSRERLKFCTVGPNSCGFSVWNPLHITGKTFMWFQGFETFLYPYLCKLFLGADTVSDYVR